MSDVAFDVRRFMSRPEWMDEAACRGRDANLFHPTGREDAIERALATARTICRRCDVQAECLAFALNGRESGIWAGTSDAQRRRILRGGNPGRGPLPPPPTALDAHEHGTSAGYRAHRYRGTAPCDACKTAHAIDKSYDRPSRAGMSRT